MQGSSRVLLRVSPLFPSLQGAAAFDKHNGIAGPFICRAPVTVHTVLTNSLRGVQTKQFTPVLSAFLNICPQIRKQDPGYE